VMCWMPQSLDYSLMKALIQSILQAEYNNASVASAAVASMSMLTQDLKWLNTDIPLKIPCRTSLPSSSSALASGHDVIHPTVDSCMDSDKNFHQ
jgi:hypothetical protein